MGQKEPSNGSESVERMENIKVRIVSLAGALAAGFIPAEAGTLRNKGGASVPQNFLASQGDRVLEGKSTGNKDFPVIVADLILPAQIVHLEEAKHHWEGQDGEGYIGYTFTDGSAAVEHDDGSIHLIPMTALMDLQGRQPAERKA